MLTNYSNSINNDLMDNLKTLNGKYDSVFEDAQKLLRELTTGRAEGKSLSDPTMAAKNDEWKAKNKEMEAIQADIQLANAQKSYEKINSDRKQVTGLPGMGRGEEENAYKSLGQSLVESDSFKAINDFHNIGSKLGIEVKNWKRAFFKTTGADIGLTNVPLFPQLVPTYVSLPVFPPMIMDFLPKFAQEQNSYQYYQETEQERNAGTQVNEFDSLVKSGFKSQIVTVLAEPIGTYFRVSESQLQDNSNIRSLLDSKAELYLNLEAERQIFSGSGSGELLGLYNVPNIGTYVRGTNPDSNGGAENNIDAISWGIKELRIDGVCNPSFVGIHPDNMQKIRLLKDANDRYLYSNPADDAPKRIWGINVLETPHATSGTAIAGDLMAYTRLGIRTGANIVLERMGDDLKQLAFTLRIYERMSLEVTRPLAIEAISNLD